MKEVVILVEGQTEEAFIKEVVAPSLLQQEIYLFPRLLKTSSSSKGGGINYDRFRHNARASLLQRSDTFLTTFFDLYGLGKGFPNLNKIQTVSSPSNKSRLIENELHNIICNEFNVLPERFFPHIQPYEYEGLLFSDVGGLIEIEPAWSRFLPDLEKVSNQFKTPEHINDSYDTKPSKRLENILQPKYRKVRHGPIIAKRITLPVIERECGHFKSWMDKLRNL